MPVKAADLMRKAISPSLRGTRLAAHLIEIRDRFGATDETLRGLVTTALKGGRVSDGKDVFTHIRDRLLVHALPDYGRFGVHTPRMDDLDPAGLPVDYQKRAKELATSYNWHRVSHSLDVQDAVADYLDTISSDRIKGRHYRAAHRIYGDSRPSTATADPATLTPRQNRPKAANHDAFWAGLRAHVQRTVGNAKGYANVPAALRSDAFLENALTRLANAEEYREELAARGPKRELLRTRGHFISPKATGVDYLSWLPGAGSAWAWKTPETQGVGGGKTLVATAKKSSILSPEQYQHYGEVLKYGVLGSVLGAADNLVSKVVDKTAGKVVRGLGAGGPQTKDNNASEETSPTSSPTLRKEVNGILHGGTDDDSILKAQAELAGLNHAMTAFGLILPTDNRWTRVKDYAKELRAHVLANPDDPVSRFYTKTAGRLDNPLEIPGDGGVTGSRYKADSLPVGHLDLSKALGPLVRMAAVRRGEMTSKKILPADVYPSLPDENEHPGWEEVTPENSPAAPPTDPAELEEWAANILKEKKRVRAEEARDPFGSGRHDLHVAEDDHPISESDFTLPEIKGDDSLIKEIEATPTRLRPDELPTDADTQAAIDAHLAKQSVKGKKLGKLKLRDRLPKKKEPQGKDVDPNAPTQLSPIKVRSRGVKPLPTKPKPKDTGEPLGLPEHFARAFQRSRQCQSGTEHNPLSP